MWEGRLPLLNARLRSVLHESIFTGILAACVITSRPVLPRSLGPTAWSRCQREDVVCLDLSVDQERQMSLKMLPSATRKWRHRARNENG